MKKSYYLAAAVVTAFAATASADTYRYQQQQQPPQYYDDQQQQPPQRPQDDGQYPAPAQGINIYGQGNTVIVQVGPDGQAQQAYVPSACQMNPQACNLNFQPLVQPNWNCGANCYNPGYYGYNSYYQYQGQPMPLVGSAYNQGFRYYTYATPPPRGYATTPIYRGRGYAPSAPGAYGVVPHRVVRGRRVF